VENIFATSKAHPLQDIKYRDEYTIPKKLVVIILCYTEKNSVIAKPASAVPCFTDFFPSKRGGGRF
jgi:hypothetical protein